MMRRRLLFVSTILFVPTFLFGQDDDCSVDIYYSTPDGLWRQGYDYQRGYFDEYGGERYYSSDSLLYKSRPKKRRGDIYELKDHMGRRSGTNYLHGDWFEENGVRYYEKKNYRSPYHVHYSGCGHSHTHYYGCGHAGYRSPYYGPRYGHHIHHYDCGHEYKPGFGYAGAAPSKTDYESSPCRWDSYSSKLIGDCDPDALPFVERAKRSCYWPCSRIPRPEPTMDLTPMGVKRKPEYSTQRNTAKRQQELGELGLKILLLRGELKAKEEVLERIKKAAEEAREKNP